MKIGEENKYLSGTTVSGAYLQEALSGQSGRGVFTGPRGKESLIVYSPLDVEGFNWACISKIDKAEAFKAVNDLGYSTLLIAVGLIILVLGIAWYVARGITKPLNRAAKLAENHPAG